MTRHAASAKSIESENTLRVDARERTSPQVAGFQLKVFSKEQARREASFLKTEN